jgi:GT2 family glycosyltransferase
VSLSAVVPAADRPATLEDCAAAIRASRAAPEELLLVDSPPGIGPAAARNVGAARANGEVLVFVDADVVVHEDAFERIRAAFDADPSLTALFGSYDDAPRHPGVVSGFRNLLHHHVHQSSAGPAVTFWAGLGAIRRDAFLAAGGFDSERFDGPAVEDIELGMRLAAEGARIRLDPELLGTHLKGWTLGSMVATDLLDRGAPWVGALLRHGRRSSALNLGWRHRLSAAASGAGAAAVLARRPRPALAALSVLLALNASFYALLWRRRGPLTAAAGVGLHALHHLTSIAAVPLGVAAWLKRGRARGASDSLGAEASPCSRSRSPQASRSPPPWSSRGSGSAAAAAASRRAPPTR